MMDAECDDRWTGAYDSIGNRVTSSEAGGGNALYDRNRLNQYPAITWPATETLGRRDESLTYDADGNLTASGLLAMDSDRDADVDLVDFTLFQNCFNGPNRPPNCLGSLKPMRYAWDAENRLAEAAPIFPQCSGDPGGLLDASGAGGHRPARAGPGHDALRADRLPGVSGGAQRDAAGRRELRAD